MCRRGCPLAFLLPSCLPCQLPHAARPILPPAAAWPGYWRPAPLRAMLITFCLWTMSWSESGGRALVRLLPGSGPQAPASHAALSAAGPNVLPGCAKPCRPRPAARPEPIFQC